jgi:redox-sensitive bicupin YhaK (pirin superfamily)
MTSEIELILSARGTELPGGMHVLRALPQAQRRMVGPFIFLDHFGPVSFASGHGMNVLAHPHIGLSTVTYLLEGEAMHRDSLGSVQRITPGDVNWMTAGRGIVHSERATEQALEAGGRIAGIQLWVALPREHEDCDPTFAHHPAHSLPHIEQGGTRLRLIAGSLFGARSPVKTHSRLFYAVAQLEPGSVLRLPPEHEERAAYVLQGTIDVGARGLRPGDLAVFTPKAEILIRADECAHILLFGGEPLEGPRNIWWNFVSSSKDRIAQAKEEWRAQRFPKIPGEADFIPLP